ncbi:tetratricopeptide repeat protein [Methylocystis parvus]|uniref:protein O-GlcNAc transferase n=1 Tax=Methylocystis parvus TaxID=134 RepID=A0A6B8M8G3_9HYPH|nr:tetratricopeptide repeat protein [Methylocystis parvus]QGM98876.1 tetratricopeptide repeat protein [Methylocystis parvus]WBK00769.1 tetratricopeptide repeat protein [Methylocystis parvus OBBP]
MSGEREKIEKAIGLFRSGDAAGAERLLKKVVAKSPAHFDALYMLGVLLHRTGRQEEAARYLSRAARAQPQNPDVHNTLGAALYAAGRPDDALAALTEAIRLAPERLETLINRADLYAALERFDEAAADYEAVLALDRAALPAYLRLAEIRLHAGAPEQALSVAEAALAMHPMSADVRCVRGNALCELGRFQEALADYDQALAFAPDVAGFHLNRAEALAALDRADEALESYDRALALAPGDAEIFAEKGNLLRRLDRLDDSVIAFNKAIALDPKCAAAYAGRAANLLEAGYRVEALRDYETLAELRGDANHLIELRGFIRRQMCDWSLAPTELSRIEANLREGREIVSAFAILSISGSEAINAQAARLMAPRALTHAPAPKRRFGEKIRIGYFSADFHEHATSHLLAAVLENADRAAFELIGFSFGPQSDDAYRRRISAAFDAFHDVRRLSDEAVAALAREAGVDVAVDLKGLTKGHRAGIFARRAAPIQVNYLGYPASMGAGYIDYIVADRIVIPPGAEADFAEKVIYLPDCYQPNDPSKAISGRAFSRADFGLPEDAFVFCCFNNSYKILPQIFDVWMRALTKTPNAVLWLIEDNKAAVENLGHAAAARGVDASRLVFSSRIRLDEHLARHKLADLFLDTSPYNAHTTASDAIFAGVPVLTCAGSTFAGRVAASLLNAAGLPNMIAENLAAYEALAIELASQPERLSAMRAHLESQGEASPLFDARRYARSLETAYAEIYRRSREGLEPDHIQVAGD